MFWEIRAPGFDKGAALRAIVAETGARQVVSPGMILVISRRSGLYANWGRLGVGNAHMLGLDRGGCPE